VGWTGRAINNDIDPKYNNMNVPKNFLFNCDVLTKLDRKFVIIVEGIFDAKAIDGVATMGAKLNGYQIDWLNSCPIPKIVVPDRDHTGKRLIQVAIDNNWHVSLPSVGARNLWNRDIKDVDDAVKRYGKLWTLKSILLHKTNNQFEISSIENSIK
jgi:DNA primase